MQVALQLNPYPTTQHCAETGPSRDFSVIVVSWRHCGKILDLGLDLDLVLDLVLVPVQAAVANLASVV